MWYLVSDCRCCIYSLELTFSSLTGNDHKVKSFQPAEVLAITRVNYPFPSGVPTSSQTSGTRSRLSDELIQFSSTLQPFSSCRWLGSATWRRWIRGMTLIWETVTSCTMRRWAAYCDLRVLVSSTSQSVSWIHGFVHQLSWLSWRELNCQLTDFDRLSELQISK